MTPRSLVRVLGYAVGLLGLVAGTAAGAQTFSVSVSPQSVTMYPGEQNVPLTVTATSSTYTGPVVVTVTGLPSGISVSGLTLTAGQTGTIYLSASVAADQEDFPNSYPGPNTTAAHSVSVVGVAGAVSSVAGLSLTVSIGNPAFAPEPSQINLPVVTINTGGTAVVDKTTDVPGTITITSADGQTSYLPNSSDGDNTATFHVHGNSTSVMPKLPYDVKLNTSLDLLHTMGLSCPYVTSSGKAVCDKSKSYLLLANYDDKTFLRDWSASALANAIPLASPYLSSPAGSPSPSGTSTMMPWASHSLFVELYLNGVYEGNYQLIEKIKVDSHRVNINEQGDSGSGDVSGGYLMEIDQHADEDYVFYTPQGLPIGMIDPDFTPEVAEQTAYITSYVDDAENALFSSTYTSPTTGWRAYFDEAAAVNFYIVNDLMGNVDGGDFYSSVYFYKDIDNPLIYMGPIWDFDISSGNVNYAAIENPTVEWMRSESPWYDRWFKDSGFKADVVTQWNALKNNGVFTSWLASITQEATTLQQSQANNFGRWPMQGIEVWPNPEAAGSYSGELQFYLEWLQLRMAWLDAQFNNKAATTTTLTVPTGTLRSGAAAMLAAQVSGTTTTAPTGTVSFLSNGVVLGTGALDGSGNASLTTTGLQVGGDGVQAVYGGDTTNALSASATQGVNVVGSLLSTVTSLASSTSTAEGDSGGDEDAPIALNVSVLGNFGTGTPTGSVTFTSNGKTLGSANLGANGTASYSASQLPIGSDPVEATYDGDGTYGGSVSNAVTITVTAAPQFSLAVSPASATVTSGKSTMLKVTVTPQNNITLPISFACTGLPSGETCSFSPATVTPGNAPANTTMTISGTLTSAGSRQVSRSGWGEMACGVGLALLLWPSRRRRRMFGWIVLVGVGLALSGCGGGAAKIVSVSTVTVTASGGGISASQTISLSVSQ